MLPAALWLAACRDSNEPRADIVARRWSRPLAEEMPLLPRPAISDSVVYVGVRGSVQALNLRDGAMLWERTLPDVAVHAAERLLANAQHVVITSDQIVALSAGDGRVRWSVRPATSAALASNSLVDDRLYYGTQRGEVFALDATTGQTLWRWALDDAAEHPILVQGITVAGDSVYVALTQYLNASGGLRRGVVAAVRRVDGTRIWTHARMDSSSSAHASPAIAGSTLLISNFSGGQLFALDRRSGVPLWSRDGRPDRFGPSSTPVVEGSVGYSGSNDGTVAALQLPSGLPIWERDLGTSVSDLVACGSHLLARNLAVSALSKDSGRVEQSAVLRSIGAPSSSAVVRDGVAVIVGERSIEAFDCR